MNLTAASVASGNARPTAARGKPYAIQSVKKQKDGSSVAVVTLMMPEQRTREVPFTVMVPQTRTRTVAGKEQTYTVNVPEQRTRTETYTVTVPIQQTVNIPKGEDKDKVIAAFAKQKLRRR